MLEIKLLLIMVLPLVAGAPTGWRGVAPGMEALAVTVPVQGSFSPYLVRVKAVRLDRAKWNIRIAAFAQPKQVHEVCPADGAAINATFYDLPTNTPIGLLVIDRVRHPATYLFTQPKTYGPWGIFLVEDGKPALRTDLTKLPKAEYLLQCSPPLLADGKLQPYNRVPAYPRSAVGMDRDGRVIFAVCENPVPMDRWATLLRDNLGCTDALNLDGGPSTQLAVRHRGDVLNVDAPNAVPVYLIAEPAAVATDDITPPPAPEKTE